MSGASPGAAGSGVVGVVEQLRRRLDALPESRWTWRPFLATYLRTTVAVGRAVADGRFEDPEWVDRWDVAFAGLYLDAFDAALAGDAVPGAWRPSFEAPREVRPVRRVLLGINAHINYDLPQALLAVIGDGDFEDPVVMASRRRDHERIDGVLAARVRAEDDELGPESTADRLLAPLNHLATRRFLAEARRKVWHNTFELHAARLLGEEEYRTRLAELELLCAAKVADLLEPGPVVLRLAVRGFGVTLPPPR
jgi:uncharacterized protein DUF5995